MPCWDAWAFGWCHCDLGHSAPAGHVPGVLSYIHVKNIWTKGFDSLESVGLFYVLLIFCLTELLFVIKFCSKAFHRL